TVPTRRRNRDAADDRLPASHGGNAPTLCARAARGCRTMTDRWCLPSPHPAKKPPTVRPGAFFNHSDLLARIHVVASRPAQIPRSCFYTDMSAIAQAAAGFWLYVSRPDVVSPLAHRTIVVMDS